MPDSANGTVQRPYRDGTMTEQGPNEPEQEQNEPRPMVPLGAEDKQPMQRFGAGLLRDVHMRLRPEDYEVLKREADEQRQTVSHFCADLCINRPERVITKRFNLPGTKDRIARLEAENAKLKQENKDQHNRNQGLFEIGKKFKDQLQKARETVGTGHVEVKCPSCKKTVAIELDELRETLESHKRKS